MSRITATVSPTVKVASCSRPLAPLLFRRPQRALATVVDERRMPVPQPKMEITAEVGGQANVDKLLRLQRDFRSDTMTMPSDAQLLSGLQASRGDDVYGEDPTTTALEERIARMAGKEAALFVSSGTMGNQLAIRTHMTQPPHSLLCDYRAHIHKMEAGGIAVFSQATTHQLFPSNAQEHHLTLEDILPHVVEGFNIHTAPTRLICLENTLSGMIFPQAEIVRIAEMAHAKGIGMHLDGARLWEVAARRIDEEGLDAASEQVRTDVVTDLLRPFDTASLCLSKGLGAPIGSAIVGPRDFIDRAKWFRKMFGGGVRQIGATAAQADYALTHHFPRLAGTHALAKRLEQGLRELGVEIMRPVETNMVFANTSTVGIPCAALIARCAALSNPITVMRERLVIHHQTSPQAVEDLIEVIREMKAEAAQGATFEAAEQQLGEVERERLEEGKLRGEKGEQSIAAQKGRVTVGY